jgi:hypothetical protein
MIRPLVVLKFHIKNITFEQLGNTDAPHHQHREVLFKKVAANIAILEQDNVINQIIYGSNLVVF